MLKKTLSPKTGQPLTWLDIVRDALSRFLLPTHVQAPTPLAGDWSYPIMDVELSVGEAPVNWHLLVLERPSGQPRYAREAIAVLQSALSKAQNSARCHGVMAAPFISKESQDTLREAGMGWVDLAGNTRLSFGGIHIDIQRAERDPFTTKRAQQSLFAPKSARLLRLMLRESGPWRVTELSQRTGVSLGQVSSVRSMLLEKEWAQIDPNGGVRLQQPAALLDAWREVAKQPKVIYRGHTLMLGKDFDLQLQLLFGQARLQGAQVMLATHSVARRTAPFARMVGEFFYADAQGLALLKEHFQLAPADKGENITVLEPIDDAIWSESTEQQPTGIRSASLIQTYLDLSASGERSREAADHLRRELIDPLLKAQL